MIKLSHTSKLHDQYQPQLSHEVWMKKVEESGQLDSDTLDIS